MNLNKVILTNVQYGKKTVPPITLTHLAAQITSIPIEIIDSQGISIDLHRKYILDADPRVVCISFMSNEASEAFRITKYLKNNGIEFVIHGGVHPTIFPNISLESGADFVITGEADLSFPQLLNKLNAGIIPDSRIINSPLPDLTNIRSLNWSSISLHEYSSRFIEEVQVPIFSSRGCTGRCTFCYSPTGRRGVRRFSKEQIYKNIENAYKKGYMHFMFYDDDYLQDLPYATSMSKDIQNIFPGIKWDCMASVKSLLKAKDHLGVLINNGLEGCHVGIESLDDNVLASMKKNHNSHQSKAALSLLLHSDILIKEALLIALYEKDTPKSQQSIVDYLSNIGIDPSMAKKWIQYATPLPGTPFYDSSRYSGFVFEGLDTNRVNYIPYSFMNYDLGHIKIKSSDLHLDGRLINAFKSGGCLTNIMSPEQCRNACFRLIEDIYDQKIGINI